jgi:hypothetical protein
VEKSGTWKRWSCGVTAGETRGVNCAAVSRRVNSPVHTVTYGVVFAQVHSLFKQGLLRVHLLEVARCIAVHLDAVGRGRDPRVRAIHVLRMAVRGHPALTKGHAELEVVVLLLLLLLLLLLRCARPAIALISRDLYLRRTEVQRVGQLRDLLRGIMFDGVGVVDGEVKVNILKVQ